MSYFKDPRAERLAQTIVDYSIDVKEGDKVVICTSGVEELNLVRECMKLCLKRKAQVYLDVMGWNWLLDRSSKGDLVRTYYEYADKKLLSKPPDVYKNIVDWGDKFIRLTILDNTSHLVGVDEKKQQTRSKAREGLFRKMINEKSWVLTYLPTDGMAQQAKLSTLQLTDFYYDAVLVDYTEMTKKGQKIADVLDNGNEVHIVGEKTDLKIYIKGRKAKAASGTHNLPDGEVFIAPEHRKTEGNICYDLVNFKDGTDVVNAYFEFNEGKIVKATADQGENVVKRVLDTDEGARYIGELGCGINYGIKDAMRQTLFDEKIGGTIHVTPGQTYLYADGGGCPDDPNNSSVHWDLVKDMRKDNCYIEVDGKKVFEKGQWLV